MKKNHKAGAVKMMMTLPSTEETPVFAFASGCQYGNSFKGWFRVRHAVKTHLRTLDGGYVYSATGEYVTGRFVGQTVCALVPCFYTEPVNYPLIYSVKKGAQHVSAKEEQG